MQTLGPAVHGPSYRFVLLGDLNDDDLWIRSVTGRKSVPLATSMVAAILLAALTPLRAVQAQSQSSLLLSDDFSDPANGVFPNPGDSDQAFRGYGRGQYLI